MTMRGRSLRVSFSSTNHRPGTPSGLMRRNFSSTMNSFRVTTPSGMATGESNFQNPNWNTFREPQQGNQSPGLLQQPCATSTAGDVQYDIMQTTQTLQPSAFVSPKGTVHPVPYGNHASNSFT